MPQAVYGLYRRSRGGRRLTRAREDVAGLSMDEAASLVGNWMLTTKSTISRLEAHTEMPTGPRSASRRQLAYMLCLCYEIDPAEFGLDPDDVPPGLSIPRRSHGDDGSVLSTSWYTHPSRSQPRSGVTITRIAAAA